MTPERAAAILEQRRQLQARNAEQRRRWLGDVAFGLEGDCEQCGGPLPPQLYAGRPRRWCSNACRMRHARGRRQVTDC